MIKDTPYQGSLTYDKKRYYKIYVCSGSHRPRARVSIYESATGIKNAKQTFWLHSRRYIPHARLKMCLAWLSQTLGRNLLPHD